MAPLGHGGRRLRGLLAVPQARDHVRTPSARCISSAAFQFPGGDPELYEPPISQSGSPSTATCPLTAAAAL
jgi:hypothetical protein